MMKKILIGLSVFAVLTIIAFLSLDRSFLYRYIEQQLISAARDAGVRLSLTEPTLGVSGIRARRLEAFIAQLFLPLEMEEVAVTPYWTGLALLKASGEFSARAYGGSILLKGSRSLRGDVSNAQIEVKDLELAEHPYFSRLGITRGTLSLTIPSVHVRGALVTDGDGTLKLAGVSKPDRTFFQYLFAGSFIPIPIPPVRDVSLEARATLKERELFLDVKKFDSSLGSAQVRGPIVLSPAGRVERVDLHGSVTLTDEGSIDIGPLLPGISADRLLPQTREFEFSVSGAPPYPTTTFRQLR